ncbi:unnamed protein product [Symbiodinium microadriaticum]|nr:unnamed protein product [Symbiodinium microadriaticum]
MRSICVGWIGLCLARLPVEAIPADSCADSSLPDDEQQESAFLQLKEEALDQDGRRRAHRRRRRRRRRAREDSDVTEQCDACCKGLKAYEVCGWCPEKRSCLKVHHDKSSCVVVTSENQCWSAVCPAAMSKYVGKIASHRKDALKLSVAATPLVQPYPTYQGSTGIFDLASGQATSAAGGGPVSGKLLGLAGDWGSGTCESSTVAKLMAREKPDLTFHLGDVYFVGDAEDFQNNVMGQKPAPESRHQMGVTWPMGKQSTFLMAGNHEAIDGMKGLVYQGYQYSGQKANYGAWQSDHWRFIALDTGYLCFKLNQNGSRDIGKGGETDAPQPKEVVDWLMNTVKLNNPNDKRGIVLLTHHMPYSDFEHVYLGTAMQLQNILPKSRTVVWFFGHEHRFALYDKLKLNEHHFKSDYAIYPRLVGNGGYRITPKSPTHHKRHLKLKAYDKRLYQEVPDDDKHKMVKLGFNGYFKILVDGPDLLVNYISARCKAQANESGVVYNSENTDMD